MKVTVIQKDKEGDLRIVQVSKSVFATLKLSIKTEYTFRFGQRTGKAFIEPYGNDNNLYLPENILRTLLLPSEVSINIWLKDGDIYLGPVVGIFVNTHFLSKLARNKAPRSANLNAEAALESACTMFYFSVDSIDWINNKIEGLMFVPFDRCWKKSWLPLPNVFYDKGVSFRKDQQQVAKFIRRQVKKHPNIELINSQHYLGKWQLFKRLNKYRAVTEYLPATVQCDSFQVVEEQINRYDLIFLKSYYGSRGLEVLAIERINNSYKLSFKKDEELVQIVVKKITEVKSYIKNIFGNEKIIVQQGIKLLTLDSRPMDMRILIVKDGNGKWKSIYNQVSISPRKFPITNNEEADMANYEDICNHLKRERKNIPSEIQFYKETIKVAKFIEKEFGPFGEIGMDMALDQAGRIWFIEANAKPEKEPIGILEKYEGVCPQFLEIFNYSKFLTGVNYGG